MVFEYGVATLLGINDKDDDTVEPAKSKRLRCVHEDVIGFVGDLGTKQDDPCRKHNSANGIVTTTVIFMIGIKLELEDLSRLFSISRV